MARRINWSAALALLAATAFPTLTWAEGPPPEVQTTLNDFRKAVQELDDASVLFTRKEWLNGAYRPYQELEMKYRRDGDIYIRFVGKNNQGREVLWRPTIDPDVMLVKPSPILPMLKLPPDGPLSKKDSRHHIGMASFHALAERILGELDKLDKNPALSGEFADLGQKTVLERRAKCFQVDLPRAQDPSLYADRIELCFDVSTDLPVTLRAWEKSGEEFRLVEDYTWTEVRMNPGFEDDVFDPENPDYNF